MPEEHGGRLSDVVHAMLGRDRSTTDVDGAVSPSHQRGADARRSACASHPTDCQRRDHHRPAVCPPLPDQRGRHHGEQYEQARHDERSEEQMIRVVAEVSADPLARLRQRNDALNRRSDPGPCRADENASENQTDHDANGGASH